jgi:hypothetical protein
MRNYSCIVVVSVCLTLVGCALPVDFGNSDAIPEGSSAQAAVPPKVLFTTRQKTFPERTAFDWPSAGIVFNFNGTGASVDLDDEAGYFAVEVDGVLQPAKLLTTPGRKLYTLASGLAPGKHSIGLYRLVQGEFRGPTNYYGVTTTGGKGLLPPPKITRRIEVIGDSFSMGHGIDNFLCDSHLPQHDNAYLSYPAITARAFGAELHNISKSGRGVVVNYSNTTNTMPSVYDWSIMDDGGFAKWEHANWHPHVIIVNIGDNDFESGLLPGANQTEKNTVFQEGYVLFLQKLRKAHPLAFILCGYSPSSGHSNNADVMKMAVNKRRKAGDQLVSWVDFDVHPLLDNGCGHQGRLTHQKQAELLIAAIQAKTGWKTVKQAKGIQRNPPNTLTDKN